MRWIVRILGLVVILAIAAVVLVMMLPADRMGRLASNQLSSQLGRDVTLQDVSLSFFPTLGIDAGGIKIANPDWAGDSAFLTAERAQIGIDARDALARKITVRTLALTRPDVALLTNQAGQANWVFESDPAATPQPDTGATQPSAPGALPQITFDTLTITDGRLTYSAAGAAPVVVEALNLSAEWPDQSGPLTLDVAARALGADAAAKGQITTPLALLNGQDSPLDLTLGAGGGTVALRGTANLAPAVNGALSVNTDNLPAMLAALGVQGVQIPAPYGPGLQLAGTVQATDTAVALQDTQITAGTTQINGSAQVALTGERPRLTGTLAIPLLDLSAPSADTGAGGGDSAASDGWPKDPIDAAALGLLDADVSLRIDAIQLPDTKLGPLQSTLVIDTARAVAELSQLQAFGGQITGQFVANNRSGLSVRAVTQVRDIALKDALVATAGVDRLEGTAGLTVNLLGSGSSVNAIMRSLRGDVSLSAGPGVLTGINLNAILGGGEVEGGTTVFDSMTATFAVADGVMRGDDLVLGLPRLRATGEGRIDLGAQAMDYTLSVEAPEARGGRGLVLPVTLKGPWSDVAMRADLKAALEQNLAEEREELEERVRERAEEAISEQLGVDRQEGESLEDAVRDRVEDEVKDRLRGLFNR